MDKLKLGKAIATGNTATIYVNDKTIMKVYKDYLPPAEAEMEAKKQRFAHACGLPVPKVLDVTMIENKQVLIMEYIKGKTLGELLFKNEKKVEYYMSLSIDIQRQIHQHGGEALEPISYKWERQIADSLILDEESRSLLLKKLKAMPHETKLCHGDMHLFNLIKAEGGVFIIDWVDEGAGDSRADVCRTYLLYAENHQDLADLYLHIYCNKTGLTKEDILQWIPIVAAARLSENVSEENLDKLLKIIQYYLYR